MVGSVLGALALARSCLIDADQKATCDAELSAKLAPSPPPLPASEPVEADPFDLLPVNVDPFELVPVNETDRLKAAAADSAPLPDPQTDLASANARQIKLRRHRQVSREPHNLRTSSRRQSPWARSVSWRCCF